MKIGISLGNAFKIKTPDMVSLVASVGFEAISPSMPLEESEPFDLAAIAQAARKSGVCLSGMHAPFLRAAAIWDDVGEAGERGLSELLEGVRLCERYEIPTLVLHAWIGFTPYAGPTALGFERMDIVVREAERRGVRLAVENTEGEEYLFALLDRYKGERQVGFCFDSGHERCYNKGKDLLALFGDRLFFTHLNDNLGVSDSRGIIKPTDDLHLLPFDGIIDWSATAARLKKSTLPEVLNFELNIKSKPGRHENDKYEKMTYEEYFSDAFRRAERVADLIRSAEN